MSNFMQLNVATLCVFGFSLFIFFIGIVLIYFQSIGFEKFSFLNKIIQIILFLCALSLFAPFLQKSQTIHQIFKNLYLLLLPLPIFIVIAILSVSAQIENENSK